LIAGRYPAVFAVTLFEPADFGEARRERRDVTVRSFGENCCGMVRWVSGGTAAGDRGGPLGLPFWGEGLTMGVTG
jgi:hypothetical protein